MGRPPDSTRTRALKLVAELQALIADWDRPPTPREPRIIHPIAPVAGEPRLLSIPEAQAVLGISRTTLFRLLSDGDLAGMKIGRRTVIPSREIDAYIAAAMTPEETP